MGRVSIPEEPHNTAAADLSPATSRARHDEERRQGETIAAKGLEHIWGWSGPAGRLRAERRARFMIEAARLGPGVRCLELGAGTGEFTARLAQTGCDLTAIELSEATAAICRSRVGPSAEVLVGNLETGEGLEGREFDAIVGVSVLHHVNLGSTLQNTFGRLRSGGRFAFSEPNMANPQVWAQLTFGPLRRARRLTEHETAFSVAGLRRQLEEGGLLRVEICEPFDFLHPGTPARLIGAVQALERVAELTPLRAIAGSIRVAGQKR